MTTDLFRMACTLVLVLFGIAAFAAPEATPTGDATVVLQTPGLIAFWNFAEPAGTARHSKAAEGALPLQEVGGSIPRVVGGPFSGHAAELDGTRYFRLPYEDTGALNICGPEAQVSMFAVVRIINLNLAGEFRDVDGKKLLSDDDLKRAIAQSRVPLQVSLNSAAVYVMESKQSVVMSW